MESRVKSLVFGLCHFHAITLERRKYGPQGYNVQYPFSIQDLRCSILIVKNYMDTTPVKIPWADLRYLIGDIIYGGHIVDDFDRTYCASYLEFIFRDELLQEMNLYPFSTTGSTASFLAPDPGCSYEKVRYPIHSSFPPLLGS